MKTRIKDIMSKDLIWVDPDHTLYEALKLMREFDIRHLPVCDRQTRELKGILSEGDVILFCQRYDHRLEVNSDTLVREAMTKNVVYCFPESDIANVAATMIAAKIDSIPVMDPDTTELTGIVTTVDFLDHLCMEEEMNGKVVNPIDYSAYNSRNALEIKQSS